MNQDARNNLLNATSESPDVLGARSVPVEASAGIAQRVALCAGLAFSVMVLAGAGSKVTSLDAPTMQALDAPVVWIHASDTSVNAGVSAGLVVTAPLLAMVLCRQERPAHGRAMLVRSIGRTRWGGRCGP